MDTLTRLNRHIGHVDEKMIMLFEKRMRMVRAMTKYKQKYDIKLRRHDADIIQTTVCNAADVETIVYTEGLIRYLECAAQKYMRFLMKHS